MTRNLKALGLALVAVFAMSVAAASAASAAELTATNGDGEHETGSLHAVQNESNKDKLGLPELATTCSTSTATGEVPGGTASELTLIPTYHGCTTGGLVTHVSMNGCDYLLHAGESIGEDKYKVTADIKCSEENEITLTVTNLFQTKSTCTIHIPGQEVGGSGILTDLTDGTVELEGEFEKITYNAESISGVGCLGNAGEHNNAVYTGTTIAEDTGGLDLSVD